MAQAAAIFNRRTLVASARLPRASFVHSRPSFPKLTHKSFSASTYHRKMSLDSYLVTPKQLQDALQDSSSRNIIPLCASWFMPNDPERRTGLQTFLTQRIPGARFFDVDGVKDHSSPYPHMLPSGAEFAQAMGELGITNTDTVVVYDTKELGIFSAPRVAWTLRAFGHTQTHVLNNFRLWVEQGYPTESGEPGPIEPKSYSVAEGTKPAAAVDFEFVKGVARGETDAQVFDARPKGRFDGVAPEPRPGLPSGHVPGAISIEFGELLDPKTRTMLPAARLKEILDAKGVTSKKPMVSYCGSGVTAAIIDAALGEAGVSPEGRLLYDGSWTEWAQRVKPEDKLIETST